MEEKKRPWSNLLCAAIWSVLLWMKLDTYADFLSVHNKIFSSEAWQRIQLEYIGMICAYGFLISVFLLRFLLYRRQTALLWGEAAIVTALALTVTFNILHAFPVTSAFAYFAILLLYGIALWDWYCVWRHYHPK